MSLIRTQGFVIEEIVTVFFFVHKKMFLDQQQMIDWENYNNFGQK